MKELVGTFDTETSHIRIWRTDYDFSNGYTLYIYEEHINATNYVIIKYGTKTQMLEIVKWLKPLEHSAWSSIIGRLA